MRIAILGTVHKPISKDSTGGTEVFAYHLVEELVQLEQEVTLFATSDSQTSAKLVSVCSSKETSEVAAHQSLFLPYQLLLARKAVVIADQFDIFHNNFFETFLFTAFLPFVNKPVVHTNHHDFFHDQRWKKFFSQSSENENDFYVFVSENQRRAADNISRAMVIHNGINHHAFPFNDQPGDYFLWFGRIAKKKGVKDAVLAARKAGVKLIVGGVIDKPIHQRFFDEEVKPLVSDNIKTIIRPIAHDEKVRLYQGAKALLVPISWEEPFGLTMIEAMSCGTPVIGYHRAAVPEIVEDGKTGFVVEPGVEGLVEAIREIEKLEVDKLKEMRKNCRKRVEEKFTRRKMAIKYLNLYKKLIKKNQ